MAKIYTDKYFLATRCGGLKIIKSNLSTREEYFITEHLVEMECFSYSEKAFMVAPLDNFYVLIFAEKVRSSKYESRPHENVYGYVLSSFAAVKEIVGACHRENFDRVFVKTGSIEEIEMFTNEDFMIKKESLPSDDEPCDIIDKKPLFYWLLEQIKNNKHSRVDCKGHSPRLVQKWCYEMLPERLAKKLISVSGGDCKQTCAHIVLCKNNQCMKMDMNYDLISIDEVLTAERNKSTYPVLDEALDKGKYKDCFAIADKVIEDIEKNKVLTVREELNLYNLLLDVHNFEDNSYLSANGYKFYKQLLRANNLYKGLYPSLRKHCLEMMIVIEEHCKRENKKADKNNSTAVKLMENKKKQLNDETSKFLECCLEYARTGSYKTGEHIISYRKRYFASKTETEWKIFQKLLRTHLDQPLSKGLPDSYYEMICLAFLNYQSQGNEDELLASIPYDREGLFMFIRKRCRSKREYTLAFETVMYLLFEPVLYHVANANRMIRSHRNAYESSREEPV